jgi:hypothetical protein
MLTLVLLLCAAGGVLVAQWSNQPDPGTPRTRDGKPILTAPAPRANGKPDLSGIWEVEGSPLKVSALLGEDDFSKYFINVLADFKSGEEPLQPSAPALSAQLGLQAREQLPRVCGPPSLPAADLAPSPFKIIQTPGLFLMLYENYMTFRQIYMDGRKPPVDPQPSFLGYSVGKWEGDVMVVETTGLNDLRQLDTAGHFHSEDLRVTERFHRLDFGHMEGQIVLDDPKMFTRPISMKVDFHLLPDADIIENFCTENERDARHMQRR